MEKLFILLTENTTENVPFILKLSSAAISILSLIYGIFKYWDNISEKISEISNFINIFKKSINLNKHVIFQKIDDDLKYIKITPIRTCRDEIAKNLKEIKLGIYKENILKLLEKKKTLKDKAQIIEFAKELLINSVEESTNKFKKEANNKEEEVTTSIIIKKFNSFESGQIRTAIESLNDLKSVIQTKNKNEIYDEILSIFKFLVTHIINNSNETVNQLNGELTGMMFKGRVIEQHEDKI